MNNVIICLNYQSSDETVRLVNRCLSFSSVTGIVVVDNDSPDKSWDILNEKFKGNSKVALLETGKNLGYAKGNNAGAMLSFIKFSPDVILFSNPDVAFDESVILKANSIFVSYTRCGEYVCDFRHNVSEPLISNACQRPKSFWSDYSEFFHYPHKKKPHLTKTGVEFCDYGLGGLMVFRTEAFKKAGLFDPYTFLYSEERLVGERIHNAGYQVVCDHDAFYEHQVGSSTSRSFGLNKKLSYWFKGRRHYWKEYRHTGFFGMMAIFFIEFWARVSKNLVALAVSIKHFFRRKHG